MARPKNLKKLVSMLTDEEKAAMRELLKEDPEVTQLKAKRVKLVEELDAVDARLAELTGMKRPGRKPGRKPMSKVAPAGAAPKRRGREPRVVAVAAPTAEPKQRGRKPKMAAVTTPTSSSATTAAPTRHGRKPKVLTAPTTAPAAAGVPVGEAVPVALPAPKIRRPRQPKRIIVDNDLIPPKG